ncbi:hypothetical protein [Streptomyces canus]|uniref:hypothetical protein n=1 Tax=Streptomyces canus TaxID=58343 RepID=UPI0003820028|nr:hypothetical protein [Streptomyces canus]
MSDPDDETARYRYGKAGNRLGIDRYASNTLLVQSVVPGRAKASARVTLAGPDNAVTFGGKAATVTSALATRLVVTVPADAVSGKVAATVAGKSVRPPTRSRWPPPAPPSRRENRPPV